MNSSIVVKLDARDLLGWDEFHETFSKAFGFPDFYGRNMNAWIDCMSSVDTPEDGLTGLDVKHGQMVVLHIANAGMLKSEQPDIWEALNECAAFVNWRRVKVGETPVLALSYDHKEI